MGTMCFLPTASITLPGFAKLPHRVRTGFGSAVLKAFLNNVECFMPYENMWKEVAPLACARSCLGEF